MPTATVAAVACPKIRTMTFHKTHKVPILLLWACLLTLWSTGAQAVGTRRFVLDSLKALEGGDLTGVAITSNGEVRAGWTLGKAPIPDASSVWCSVVLPDGSVLLGTGSGGRIYKVAGGKVTIAAETGAMAVSALAIGFGGDVLAGTFPEGKIYRIPTSKLDGSEHKPWLELKDTEDIWDLAFDEGSKALYAATGPEGKLYRITAAKQAEVHFDSEEAHLVSVAVGPKGSVYAGSNGKALLYRLTGPGRVEVVHDFDADDVKAIAVAPAAKGGAVYAVANKYSGSFKGLRPKTSSSGGALGTTPQPPKPAKAGKGQLMRFDGRGVAELMLKNDKNHFVTLALDDQAAPYVGTGTDGKVYTVNDNHVERLVADTEERQVGALVLTGRTRFVATTDPVVYHAITGSGGAEAKWTSKALDAGMRAHFGLLEWQGSGALEVQTRSGNTEKPDDSWSAWSPALTKAGKVKSPPARFLQIRATWSRDPAAVLRDVQVAFVTDNARALLTEVTAGDGKSETGSKKVPESGGPPKAASAKLKLKWKVENPDSDKLRYRLFYRPLGGKTWFSILDPGEELTKTDYSWDTAGVPEGRYQIRVDASDELSNPPDRVTKHSLKSHTVIVDNRPPRFTKLALRGGQLQGTVTDGVGPIARIEFALVGGKTWFPIFSTDGVFDEATEAFDLDVSNHVPAGPHLVVVKVYDTAGNVVSRTVSRTP